jgi:hypothetical protein
MTPRDEAILAMVLGAIGVVLSLVSLVISVMRS